MVTLIVAWRRKSEGERVGYADLLSFSVDYMPKPISDRTIFAAFADLESLGFLTRCEPAQDAQVGRPRELFEITSFGVIALFMAITYARHLHDCRQARRVA